MGTQIKLSIFVMITVACLLIEVEATHTRKDPRTGRNQESRKEAAKRVAEERRNFTTAVRLVKEKQDPNDVCAQYGVPYRKLMAQVDYLELQKIKSNASKAQGSSSSSRVPPNGTNSEEVEEVMLD